MHTTMNQPTKRRNQIGGLVAAIQKARANNPTAKPLPKGFIEHSQDLPELTENWPSRDFSVLNIDEVTPVIFRSRASR